MKIKIAVILLLCGCGSLAPKDNQLNQDIIDLAKAVYKLSMDKDTSEFVRKVKEINTKEIAVVAEHLKNKLLKSNSDLSVDDFRCPDSNTIRYICAVVELMPYIARGAFESDLQHNVQVFLQETDYKTWLNDYYNLIFLFAANNSKIEDFERLNFDLSKLGLSSKEAKAIFFMQLITGLQTYINADFDPGKPDFKRLSYLYENYPKVDGKKYYSFCNFDFQDFDVFYTDRWISYKENYVGLFFHILLRHAISFKEIGEYSKMESVLDESILNDTQYFQYYIDSDGLKQMIGTMREVIQKQK